jgi:uncharacterized protein
MNTNKSFIEFLATFKSIDAENQIIEGVVGSDDSVDRHGDRINPKGWDLKNYKKSPVILINHDYQSMPVGKAINVRVENNQLLFDIEFSKTYDVAIKAFNLIKEGIWKAWSVGFLVKEWARTGEDYTINKAELLELSLVTVPANPNALSPKQLGMIEEFNNLEVKTAEVVEEEKEPEVKEVIAEIQKQLGELSAKVDTFDKSIDEKIDTKMAELTKLSISETESDEELSTSPVLEALNAVQAELINQNKGSGKALQSLNELLKGLKKE